MAASGKTMPKDAQIMAAILKDMGVTDYEPRVIHQMLDFAYRYVTDILDDARVFSSHANKKSVDVDDVKLAVQLKLDSSYTAPPPRELLVEIARFRNSQQLPLIKPYTGPRLPPDRYCLSATNYKLRTLKKPQPTVATMQRILSTSAAGTGAGHQQQTQRAVVLQQQTHSAGGASVVPRINISGSPTIQMVSGMRPAAGSSSITVVTRPTVPAAGSAAPSQPQNVVAPAPTIRVVSALSAVSGTSTSPPNTVSGTAPSIVVLKQEAVDTNPPSAKRKREEADDYDA